MIKIDKGSRVPKSLNSKKTNERRAEIIAKGQYIHFRSHHSRYKTKDVKDALKSLYHGKCAYCEKDVSDEAFPIEHYRPKKDYYWLAYSWDNLLLSCNRCNVYKGDSFAIEGTRARFTQDVLARIHRLAADYQHERPKLIHPELEDIEEKLEFKSNGEVSSLDHRVQHTIDVCHISRDAANEKRKRILDEFLENCRAVLYGASQRDHAERALRGLIREFKKRANDYSSEYSAFRRWVVRNLRDILGQSLSD